jgi:Arc/MetJ-type ribon-helix-helix transcriptional regulator
MTVEINKETERLLREQLDSGHFKSVDEVLSLALIELAKRNTKLTRQRLAIQEAAGAWRDEDHPELAGGSAAWVRQIRAESKERTERIEQQRQDP